MHGVGGENSSKPKILQDYLTDYSVEKIVQSSSITETLEIVSKRIKESQDESFVLVGSSRGGLLALSIGYDFDIPVIAINPAMEMSKVNFDVGNRDVLENLQNKVMKENESIENSILTYLFLGSEDEIIDYRKAAGMNNMYLSVRKTDHRYSDLNVILPDIKSILDNLSVSDESEVLGQIMENYE